MFDGDDIITITVRRGDIRLALSYLKGYGSEVALESAAAIEAAIPEPEWEPSDEQVETFAAHFQFSLPRQRPVVVKHLRGLKAGGFTL